jgi:hypothetical protein
MTKSAASTGDNPTTSDAAAEKAEAKAAESFKEVNLTRKRDGQTRVARTPADLVKYEFEGFAADTKK